MTNVRHAGQEDVLPLRGGAPRTRRAWEARPFAAECWRSHIRSFARSGLRATRGRTSCRAFRGGVGRARSLRGRVRRAPRSCSPDGRPAGGYRGIAPRTRRPCPPHASARCCLRPGGRIGNPHPSPPPLLPSPATSTCSMKAAGAIEDSVSSNRRTTTRSRGPLASSTTFSRRRVRRGGACCAEKNSRGCGSKVIRVAGRFLCYTNPRERARARPGGQDGYRRSCPRSPRFRDASEAGHALRELSPLRSSIPFRSVARDSGEIIGGSGIQRPPDPSRSRGRHPSVHCPMT